jgi:hypothetical protein
LYKQISLLDNQKLPKQCVFNPLIDERRLRMNVYTFRETVSEWLSPPKSIKMVLPTDAARYEIPLRG